MSGFSLTLVNAPADIKGVANLILDWAEADCIEISPLKIQKILFFSHADFIIRYGRPLFNQDFEAWDYGPVNASVYQEFKKFGDGAIKGRASAFDPLTASKFVPQSSLSPLDEQRLKDRYDFYRQFSAIALSDLSHSKAGPWRQARSLFANGLNSDRRITAELIKQCHRLFDS